MILFRDETQRGLVQGNFSTSKEDEENVALTAKAKKKFKEGGAKQQGGHKGMRTVK